MLARQQLQEPEPAQHLNVVLARDDRPRGADVHRRLDVVVDPGVEHLGRLEAVLPGIDQTEGEERRSLVLLELDDAEAGSDADADDRIRVESPVLQRANGAQHPFVVDGEHQPAADLPVLRKGDIGGIEGAGQIACLLGNPEDVVGAEAVLHEGLRRAVGALLHRVQLVEGDGQGRGLLGQPAAPVVLGVQRLGHRGADLPRGDAHVRNAHESPVGPHELVIDGEDLHAVAVRLRDDGGAQAHVGRADHESLRSEGREIVDGGENLITVRRPDLDELKSVAVGAFLGELPFVLEPQLLGALHEKSYAHGIARTLSAWSAVRRGGARNRKRSRERPGRHKGRGLSALPCSLGAWAHFHSGTNPPAAQSAAALALVRRCSYDGLMAFRILIVDDEIEMCLSLSELLGSARCNARGTPRARAPSPPW